MLKTSFPQEYVLIKYRMCGRDIRIVVYVFQSPIHADILYLKLFLFLDVDSGRTANLFIPINDRLLAQPLPSSNQDHLQYCVYNATTIYFTICAFAVFREKHASLTYRKWSTTGYSRIINFCNSCYHPGYICTVRFGGVKIMSSYMLRLNLYTPSLWWSLVTLKIRFFYPKLFVLIFSTKSYSTFSIAFRNDGTVY